MCEFTTIYLIRPEFLCRHISAAARLETAFLFLGMLTNIVCGTSAASDVRLRRDGSERVK
jgi:hypothetical protein